MDVKYDHFELYRYSDNSKFQNPPRNFGEQGLTTFISGELGYEGKQGHMTKTIVGNIECNKTVFVYFGETGKQANLIQKNKGSGSSLWLHFF